MQQITDRIKKVIGENLLSNQTQEIQLEDEFLADLDFDSVRFMGLFYSLEEEFNISIISSTENYIFFSVETVQDLVDIIEKVVA